MEGQHKPSRSMERLTPGGQMLEVRFAGREGLDGARWNSMGGFLVNVSNTSWGWLPARLVGRGAQAVGRRRSEGGGRQNAHKDWARRQQFFGQGQAGGEGGGRGLALGGWLGAPAGW